MKTMSNATNLLLEKSEVLLVEDNFLQQKLVTKDFETAGCNVTLAESIEAGKSAVESSLYDFILTDMRLPDGFGVALIEHARSNSKSKNHEVPIVGASMEMETFEQACYDAGANEVILKPIPYRAILGWVQKYVRNQA